MILEFLELSWIFWGYWKCTWKRPLFQAYSGTAPEIRIFDNHHFRLQYFRLPRLDFLFVIKYDFNSVQDNLHNRPSHQVNVGPNRTWMSFSKLPHLLDGTPDHFPVFRNEKDSEAEIVSFVVMLYLLSVCNWWRMYFVSVVFVFCLLLQSIWLIYLFINCRISNYI